MILVRLSQALRQSLTLSEPQLVPEHQRFRIAQPTFTTTDLVVVPLEPFDTAWSLQKARFAGAFRRALLDTSEHPPDTVFVTFPLIFPMRVLTLVVDPRRTDTKGCTENDLGDVTFFLPIVPST